MKVYEKCIDYDKEFKDEQGIIWKCYSPKRLKETLGKGFEKKINLVGKVVKNKESSNDTILWNIENENDRYLNMGSLQSKFTFKRIKGYIKCENNQYIAVEGIDFRKIFFIAVTIILLLFAIMIPYLKDSGPKLDDSATEYVSKLKRPKDWDANRIALPGYDDIIAKKGSGYAYVALYNPKNNPVYFSFKVILDESKETLLETDLIPPGKAVKEIPIDKKLDVGEYDMTFVIKTYSLDDHKQEMNGGEVKTKLKIVE